MYYMCLCALSLFLLPLPGLPLLSIIFCGYRLSYSYSAAVLYYYAKVFSSIFPFPLVFILEKE